MPAGRRAATPEGCLSGGRYVRGRAREVRPGSDAEDNVRDLPELTGWKLVPDGTGHIEDQWFSGAPKVRAEPRPERIPRLHRRRAVGS
jgi:hypothetical protein